MLGQEATRQYTHKFAKKFIALMPKLMASNPIRYKLRDPAEHADVREEWDNYEMSDWEDAGLKDWVFYLRGSTSLEIPKAWKDHIPKRL